MSNMSQEKKSLSPSDPSSFSRPELVKITHIHLSLDVNFSTHILKGSAVLQLEKCEPSATSVVLDTRDLKVYNIEDENGKDLKFTLEEPVLSFGSKLEVQLPDNASEKCKIKVNYETSPSCTALQWLQPQQTAGKKHPYLFSQCQAIHARSLLPCQDTPAVKMPYSAEISSPAELTALMSAVGQGAKDHLTDSSKKVHIFEQKVPIPSYLVAVVVGALESRDIGPRSKVWSEKEMVDAAAYEFAETEQMLATAESLLGPYVWGVYDLLVLPPSFPYGGMENPCLTFVTPTLLAGDRSLADVVAHEISHSWTGNLVTNSNPEHFWLNEGHTVFIERKIAGRMKGEQFRHFELIGGWADLVYQIIRRLNEGHTKFVERMVVSRVRAKDNPEPFRHFLAREDLRALSYQVEEVFGKDHPFTHLVPDLKGVDPDDAFSTVPYEKGANLLMYLEQKLGGPEVFEPFLKAYIEKFKYKSITTSDWKDFLYEFFRDKKALLDEVDWDAWFYKPGMPPVKPKYDTTLSDACVTLAKKWSSASDSDLSSFSVDDLKPLSSYQVKEFLAQLLEEPALSAVKLDKMEELYKLNEVRNSEIRFRWLRLNLRGKVESVVSRALEFVTEQGRMKFVRPIYRDLFLWEQARPKAVANYDSYKSGMHSLTATMVGKDLKAAQSGKA